MFTRSILGGVLVGVAFTYIEGLSILGMLLLGHLLDFPHLIDLYRLTPSYNVANAQSWFTQGQAAGFESMSLFGTEFPALSDGLTFSVVILIIWVAVLVGLTAYLFQKQDIM